MRTQEYAEPVSYLTQEAHCTFSLNEYLKLLTGSATFGFTCYNILEIKNGRYAFHSGKDRA